MTTEALRKLLPCSFSPSAPRHSFISRTLPGRSGSHPGRAHWAWPSGHWHTQQHTVCTHWHTGVRPAVLTATTKATGIVPPNRGGNGLTEKLSLLHPKSIPLTPGDADHMCNGAELGGGKGQGLGSQFRSKHCCTLAVDLGKGIYLSRCVFCGG